MLVHLIAVSLVFLMVVQLPSVAAVGDCNNGNNDYSCPSISIGPTDTSILLQANDPIQRFSEISGIGLSPTRRAEAEDFILYVVNDSGGGTRLGLYDSGTGKRLITLRLDYLPSARDWESMAVGSCGIVVNDNVVDYTNETCIYIADVGDNAARESGGRRTSRRGHAYRIYKILEPRNYREFTDNDLLPQDEYLLGILDFDYPRPQNLNTDNDDDNTPFYVDVEAIFVDHSGWIFDSSSGRNDEIMLTTTTTRTTTTTDMTSTAGDIYLLPKWDAPESFTLNRLYRIPASAWTNDSNDVLFTVLEHELSSNFMGFTWTRADMSLDAKFLALGTYWDAHLYPLLSTSVVELFRPQQQNEASMAAQCELNWSNVYHPNGYQYETIAFWPPIDGSSKTTYVLQISECSFARCNPPMVWTQIFMNDPQDCSESPSFAPSSSPSVAPTTTPSFAPSTTPSFAPIFTASFDPVTDQTLLSTGMPSIIPTSANPTMPPTLSSIPRQQMGTNNPTATTLFSSSSSSSSFSCWLSTVVMILLSIYSLNR